MSNVKYSVAANGRDVYGELQNGTVFIIDLDNLKTIENINFYTNKSDTSSKSVYVVDSNGRYLHDYLFAHIDGYEIDHINLNTFDNRRDNIRYCTHQQNQMNQPVQSNNKSGVCGVSFYPPRKKYRARIKVSGRDIHLGYFDTFSDAVKARNIGMLCMFGQFGRYNDVDDIPAWIIDSVTEKCLRFSNLSVNTAFFDFIEVQNEQQE